MSENIKIIIEQLEQKRKFFLQRLDDQYKKITQDVSKDVEPYSKGILFFGKEISLKSRFVNDSDAETIKKFGVLKFNCERKITEFFIKNLKSTDIFYDVGANYGFYTHLAKEFCNEVHVFEPLSDIFENLENDLKTINNVYINQLALSNKNDEAFINKEKGHSGGSSLVVKTEDFYEQEKVKTISLDEYVSTHNKPTVIKIDVEGAEDLVLEGGENFFKNNSPIIIVEFWSEEYQKQSRQNTLNAALRLKNMGYKFFALNKNGDIYPYNGNFKESTESGDDWGDNFLFKKD